MWKLVSPEGNETVLNNVTFTRDVTEMTVAECDGSRTLYRNYDGPMNVSATVVLDNDLEQD